MSPASSSTRQAPQRPGSSAGFRLVAERRKEVDMERFVAGLLAFAMDRLEQEEAECAAKQAKVSPPRLLKATEYEVLVQPEPDGRFVAYATALDGCMAFGDTREAVLAGIVPEITAFLETMQRIGYKPRKARLDGQLTPEATRHVVSVPQAD